MSRVEFLVDTSAFARLSHEPVTQVMLPLVARAAVAVSAPVMFELGYAARNATDRDLILDRLTAYPYIATVEADHRRALEVQGRLSERSGHRGLSLVDGLVAAAAERAGLSVLHYDRDFERIAHVTGQRHDWVVRRGSAD